MPRVAGVDPGTVSFDLCVLQDGCPVLERVFDSGSVADDPAPLLDELRRHGPYDLVYGPSGYGLPLVAAADVDEPALAQMVLVRPAERGGEGGIGGMRSLLGSLARSGLPVVFGPGVIHLPTVPRHRKFNRIDLGTADKVCAAAWAIADQGERLTLQPGDTSFVMLELGGAFTAAIAVADGRIVDGVGGSSGPIGVRAPGALDGELAYLLAPDLGKRALFSGGALNPTGAGTPDLEGAWRSPAHADGRTALLEGAVKAVRALQMSAPDAREVVVSGRMALMPGLVEALSRMLDGVAPVIAVAAGKASAAARGGALLADGLAGGDGEQLVRTLRLREASGSVLDHLRVLGSDAIALG
jgi:predicted butyrate kinase (DUF1464 family)